jgi:hypothetical protein
LAKFGDKSLAFSPTLSDNFHNVLVVLVRHDAGYTRRDEISNITIRSELQIFNINDKITDKKKE